MAYTRRKQTKDGKTYYEIAVSRGRGKSRLTSRWYVPDGWSQKAIDRQLAAVAAEFERQVDTGEIISRSERKDRAFAEAAEAAKVLTLRQYGETIFMPTKTVTMAENSRSSYQGNLDKWIYPDLGSYKLHEITAAQIQALLLHIQAEGKAQATAVKIYTILQGLFKMAYKMDNIDRNPMDKVDRPKPRKDEAQQTEPEAYTAQEVGKLLAALNNEPLKWQALVHILIDTGIRRGECCGLSWENIDFTTGRVEICGNLCYTSQAGVYFDTAKNRKSRFCYIGNNTIAILEKLSAETNPDRHGYIFTSDDTGTPMHPQSPTKYLKRFSERYGLPELHPHKLRHTFASIAITSGADIASVSEALGHSDKAITLRMYTHATEESISKAAQIFRDAIKPQGETVTKPSQAQEAVYHSAKSSGNKAQQESEETP